MLAGPWNPCGNSRHAMPDATIHTLGRVLEVAGPVLYRVSLPNGKIILAHLSKPLTDANALFSENDEVLLELTPYDFDTARILGQAT
jgi:translation initiation factor IF-1